jgi:hypothetical protein
MRVIILAQVVRWAAVMVVRVRRVVVPMVVTVLVGVVRRGRAVVAVRRGPREVVVVMVRRVGAMGILRMATLPVLSEVVIIPPRGGPFSMETSRSTNTGITFRTALTIPIMAIRWRIRQHPPLQGQ